MSFIRVKIFYNFRNVVFSKIDRGETATCFFKIINRKFASVVDYSALFSKEIVEDRSHSVFSLKFVM